MNDSEFRYFSVKFIRSTNWLELKSVYGRLIQYLDQRNKSQRFYDIINRHYLIYYNKNNFDNVVFYLLMVWAIIFCIGVFSNSIVVYVLTKVVYKTAYDVFCIGLALTDIIFLCIAIPVTSLWYLNGDRWKYPDYLCSIVNFTIYVALFSCALMLLTLTITRFLAVVFPWKNRLISTREAKIACCIAWIVGGLFSIPAIFYFGVKDTRNLSSSTNTQNMATRSSTQAFVYNTSSNTAISTFATTISALLPTTTMGTTLAKDHEQQYHPSSDARTCKEMFPSQRSRNVYFILVFLLTYVIPFKCILIMNCMIVKKLTSKRKSGSVSLRKTPSTKHDLEDENKSLKQSPSNINADLEPSHNETTYNDQNNNDKTQQIISTIQEKREIRQRKVRNRVTKMVILVTTLYCVCWLPTQIFNIWYYTNPSKFPQNRYMQYMKFISQTLSFASACVNPIVYSVINETFKTAFRKQFPCLFKYFINNKLCQHRNNCLCICKKNKSLSIKPHNNETVILERVSIMEDVDKFNIPAMKRSLSDNTVNKSNEMIKKPTKKQLILYKTNYNSNLTIKPMTMGKTIVNNNSNINKKSSNNNSSNALTVYPTKTSSTSSNSNPSKYHISKELSGFSYEGYTDNEESIIDNNFISKV